MRLRVSNQRVEWETGSLALKIPAFEAIRLGDTVLVIHDFMVAPPNGKGSNLVCYSLSGERLWSAEMPALGATAAYVNFLSEDPLWVWNFECFRCRIDPLTGKLLEKVFTK